MYCSQCGKKVMDTMLFCPFCGSPIVIPEQEENTQAAVNEKITARSAPEERIVEKASEGSSADAEFVPLDVDRLWSEEPVKKDHSSDVEVKVSDTLSSQLEKETVQLQGRKPDLSAARPHSAPKIPSRDKSDTRIPQRRFNPDDIFFDGGHEKADDDYEEEFDFEEPERGNFFVRHIRGFVSLIMFTIVAAVLLGWACSSSGQQALARIGLAWRPSVYAEIAFSAYQNGSYSMAGDYYAEALERDSDRYEYANSAGVAYYMANDVHNAEAMALKAIEIDPARMDGYDLLLRLYPSADGRPLGIQAAFQKGYQLTGNESLNPSH